MSKKLATVVIASANEGHARLERSTIKNIGAREVQCFTTAAQVMAFLADAPCDLLVIDERLDDATGLELARQVRDGLGLDQPPMLMVAAEGDEARVLDAVAAGCGGFAVRPYSLETFERQVRSARTARSTPGTVELMLAKARMRQRQISETETALAPASANPIRDYLQQARDLLLAGDLDRCISSAQRAVAANEGLGDGWELLGRAWKGKRDLDRFCKCMQRAARAHAEQDRFLDAKAVFTEVATEGFLLDNPYARIGNRLWRRTNFHGAILAWRRAWKLTPDNPELGLTLARALAYMGEIDKALDALDDILATTPRHPEARRMHALLRRSLFPRRNPLAAIWAAVSDFLGQAMARFVRA